MTLMGLLNPFTEADEARFATALKGKTRADQQQQQVLTNDLHSHAEEDDDSVEDHVMRELRAEDDDFDDDDDDDDEDDEDERESSSMMDEDDEDNADDEKRQVALFLSSLAGSGSLFGTPSTPTTTSTSTTPASPSASSSSSFSSSPSIPKEKGLYEQKVARIVLKIRRLTKELSQAHTGIPRLALVSGEARAMIRTLPEVKIMRKTVNQSAATVAFVVLKKLGVSLPLLSVVEALKKGEKLGCLSKSTKPTYSRNQAEVLGISKMVSSLETRTSPAPEDTHSKVCQEATIKLARDLHCDEALEKLAVTYCTQSEQSSMASRHKGTVAASCVLLAAKALRQRLTLAKVSEVSGVSTCTVRKSLKALEALISRH